MNEQIGLQKAERVPAIESSIIRRVTIRLAQFHEAGLVRRIDDSVFPENSLDMQRASARELEEGVEVRDVYLFEFEARVIGYLHIDRVNPQCVHISGFGVLPALQNRGLGTAAARLALPILEEYEDKLPIYTVTSPRNTRMLHLLFNLRFAGRWFLADHFGPGKHRIGCQRVRSTSSLMAKAETRQVRLVDLDGLSRLLDEGWVIRGQHTDKSGAIFELAVGTGDDFLPYPPQPGPGQNPLGRP